MQQDDWDDTAWNTNHEHRKAKAQKTRHKGLKSSAIREGIEDYFEKTAQKHNVPEYYPEPDGHNISDNSRASPRI